MLNLIIFLTVQHCKDDTRGAKIRTTPWPIHEDVVAQWCNPLTLKPEQSGGVGSIPGSTPPLEHHDKGSRTRFGLLYFCDSSAWR